MMALWKRLGLLVCLLSMAIAVVAGELPPEKPSTASFSDELGAELYDCTVVCNPSAQLTDAAKVTLTLDAGTNKDALTITLTRQTLDIVSIVDGKPRHFDPVASQVKPGTPYHLTVLRRGDWLGLLHDQTFLFRDTVPRATGNLGSYTAGEGWTVEEPTVQRLEPVRFTDDFMRSAEGTGSWAIQRGKWALQSAWDTDAKGNAGRFSNASYAQNPFAWAGCNPEGSALCTVGKAYWEDYTFSVAVQPGADGAAGVMVNMPDANNGYLVRWTPANDRSPQGDRLTLAKVTDGKPAPISESRGGFIPGQWYKLSVITSSDGLQVLLDGQSRLTAKAVWPWRGGVGLYAEGKNGAVFDDVVVNGHRIKNDLIMENQMGRLSQRFLEDPGTSAIYNRNGWNFFPGEPSQMVYRCDMFGDHWVTLTVRPFSSRTGEMWLGLNNDGKTATSGYRAVMKLSGGKLNYTIYRDTTALVSKNTAPLATNADYNIRFRRSDNRLLLEIDGEKVLETTDTQPLTGLRPIYRAEGCFALAHDSMVLSNEMLVYTFTDEPVDWLSEGEWMQSIRWACDPRWSFLGGWSRGDAVLWHKKRFTGDQYLDAFLGIKMEYPREREVYEDRYRDLGITICGDGHNPRSGYAGIFLAQDSKETFTGPDGRVRPKRRFVLLRNGVEVKSAAVIDPPNKDTSHRNWFELTLTKRGANVDFQVDGKLIFTYTDPEPLTGGVPAIWTNDNGVNVALAEIHYTTPPQLRDEPRVIIDDPWYPEWANIGTPLKLAFPETWSTAGKTVRVTVTPRDVPSAEDNAVEVAGNQLTFTPKVIGDHWYQVSASDGEHVSSSIHLNLPVFKPALGRDDSHALLLYRFDEGNGNIVHDRSKIAPPVNLQIPQQAQAQWLPGQGLNLHGNIPLVTANNATRLLKIQQTRACTLEFWVSPDTVWPSTPGWGGCMLCWQQDNNRMNLAVHNEKSIFLFSPNSAALHGDHSQGLMLFGFRLSLQHYVVTWDGTTTKWYANGKLMQEKQIPWETAQWIDAPLRLGNMADQQHSYLGTFYLVAIHDRCFTEAEIQRHYKAGPSAK